MTNAAAKQFDDPIDRMQGVLTPGSPAGTSELSDMST